MSDTEVIVIGAGLAGLSCAHHLEDAGVECLVLEREDSVGGRVQTDEYGEFRLDRGFQVLLTAYPECRRVLDYGELDLQSFYSGALIYSGDRFRRVADPWRDPGAAFKTLFSGAGTFADKLRVGRMRTRLIEKSDAAIYREPATTTEQYLHDQGFTDGFIEQFFRPFLGGVFLEDRLETSSRLFEFVFRNFAAGRTAVPARGMQQIPEQLDTGLDSEVRCGSGVARLEENRVFTDNGAQLSADAVVVAIDMDTAAELSDQSLASRGWNGVTNLYYSAESAPVEEPILVLDGSGTGPVNNMHVASRVSADYAPEDRELISLSVLGTGHNPDELRKAVRKQMRGWFGPEAGDWEHLLTYEIDRALPAQPPGTFDPPERPVRVGDNIYRCGDYLDTASLNGALASGRRAAEALLEDRDDG